MAPSPPATPLFVPSDKGDKASKIASLHDTQHHEWECFTARWGTAARMRDTRMQYVQARAQDLSSLLGNFAYLPGAERL